MMGRIYYFALCVWLATLSPAHASLIVNWLDDPIVLFHGEAPSILVPIDLVGDGMIALTFSASISSLGVRAENSSRLLVQQPPPPDLPGPAVPLCSGFEIGPYSETQNIIWFAGHSQGPGTPGYETDFRNLILCFNGCSGEFMGQNAYLGVEFSIGNSTHYGWINLDIHDSYPFGRIHGWAYESTPGMPIMAGAIPEPTTLSLIGIGAMAILFRKKSIANNRLHPTAHKVRRG